MARNNDPMSSEETDKYINEIADIDDGDTHDTDVDVSTDNTGGTPDFKTGAPTDKTDATAKVDAGSGQQQEVKGKAPKAAPAQGTVEQQPNPAELRPLGNGAFADKAGNIVSADGKLIAEKGFAARMHQQNQRFRSQNETLTSEVNDLRTRVTELRSLDESMRRGGINADELAQALDFATRYKKGDVLGIAKEIVALAMAAGHNATDLLGKDVGDSIDMRGVKAILDERLGPIAKSRQEDEQKAQTEKVARDNYTRFVNDNEYADVHGDAIVRLARAENIPLQLAYNRLYKFAADNQLDFSMDLGPQIQERNTPAQQPTQQQPTPKPMPNGATTRASGALPAPAEPMNDADDDWGTIIKQAMATM